MKKTEHICKKSISDDFNNGKKLLKDLKNSVTIFGSARTPQNDYHVMLAQKLSFNLKDLFVNSVKMIAIYRYIFST